MSIFSSRDPKPSATPPAPARPPQPNRAASAQGGPETTLIATGSRVVGEISGSAELVIDGEVEGRIDLDSLVVVGPKGYVEGEIHALAVRVGGKVLGNIHGRERVEVQDSGRLEGDVEAPSVVIAEGAFFKGKIEMTGDRGAKAAERSTHPTKEKKGFGPHGGGPQGGGPHPGGGPQGGGPHPGGGPVPPAGPYTPPAEGGSSPAEDSLAEKQTERPGK